MSIYNHNGRTVTPHELLEIVAQKIAQVRALDAKLQALRGEIEALEPKAGEILQNTKGGFVDTPHGRLFPYREIVIERAHVRITDLDIIEMLYTAGLPHCVLHKPNFEQLTTVARKLDSKGGHLLSTYPALNGYVTIREEIRVNLKDK